MAAQERVGRRGILAVAAAVLAGFAAKSVTDATPVAASFTRDDFIQAAAPSLMTAGSGFETISPGGTQGHLYQYGGSLTGYEVGVRGFSTATGVLGTNTGNGVGVQGNSTSGFGVFGYSNGSGGDSNSAGVYGINAVQSNNAIGVQGAITGSSGTGVLGGRKGGASAFNGSGVQGLSDGGYGVYGKSIGTGVRGESDSGYGVAGYSNSSTGAGIYGENTSSYGVGVRGKVTVGQGVYGEGSYGVFGNSTVTTNGGIGVFGQVSSTAANSYAVYGNNAGSGAGNYGVAGLAKTGVGVQGTATSGVGVYGISGGGAQPFGVVGSVASAPGFGLYGVANVSGTVGFAAGAGVSGAIAGQFSGPVNIYANGSVAPGNLYIAGNYTAGGTKSAAVPHPDGSHRLLYCMESPEAWFEDFGEGTITAGKAEVKLDADFAAVVDTATLHVFCMPHDETHHLAVKATSAGGFSVAADPSGPAAVRGVKAVDLSGTFSYRVVAKRRDVKADRLTKFDLPKEIKLAPPPVPPTAPDPPKPPTPADPPTKKG